MEWELQAVLGAEIARLGLRRLNAIRHIEAHLEPKPRTSFGRIAESSMYTRNQPLRDTNQPSKAHSLEVRVPLVDVKLLRHVASVTTKSRSLSKRVLGNSPRVPLPRKVIERPKTGFGTPIQTWLQRDTRVQQWRRVLVLAVHRCAWARRWVFRWQRPEPNGRSPAAAIRSASDHILDRIAPIASSHSHFV